MAKRFQPVIKKSRFVVDGFAPEAMSRIGVFTRDSIDRRMAAGQNAQDVAGRALVPRYAQRKTRRGLNGIRDWFKTGRTRRSMQLLEAATNKAKIGFTDSVSALRARVNNLRELYFAVSPSNRSDLIEAVKREDSPVKARVE